MADKGKRLQKVLNKAGLKGQLKQARSLEEARIILIEDKQSATKFSFYCKDEYKTVLENGYTFPEDMVHFLVSANPRNSRSIERSLLTNKNGSIKHDYK